MTIDDLTQIIAEVQNLQSEMDDVEVKTALHGTPQRLFETLSAFSNRPGGGVLLLGLDESKRFENVGVGNAHRLQEEISHVAAAEMEPPLRPKFTIKDFEGKTIVAVEISEIPADRKPCYYKTAGLQKGAYIRVGNTNRQMTDYEIYGYASFRTQPIIDQEIVRDATLEDLDRNRLTQYVEDLHLVENRGSGVSAMLAAMRQANLEPPRFRDRRSSFWVTFRSHTLLNPEAVAWLNRFAEKPMNDHQRMSLVYLRHNEGMTNNDYQRLNHVDSVTATRELRKLTDYGLVDLPGSRRWAYYTLNVPVEAQLLQAVLETDEEKILAYVREHGSIKRAECQGSATKMWVSYTCRNLSPLWKRGAGGIHNKSKGI
ncbi:MAG: RNA-binding domain-containing protein, partial [Syntrophales bacterium]